MTCDIRNQEIKRTRKGYSHFDAIIQYVTLRFLLALFSLSLKNEGSNIQKRFIFQVKGFVVSFEKDGKLRHEIISIPDKWAINP